MIHKNTLDLCTIIIISFVGDRFFKPGILVLTVDNVTMRTVV
jgi:hypothetical protein